MSTETPIHHHVTIDYGTDGYTGHLALTCTAPADAPCRAVWDCDCEEFTWEGSNPDGLPVHATWESEEDEHVGRFAPDVCSLADWFAESDEVMRGSVTVPVTPKWTGYGYEFVLLGGAS